MDSARYTTTLGDVTSLDVPDNGPGVSLNSEAPGRPTWKNGGRADAPRLSRGGGFVFARIVAIIGVVLALWMSVGRWLFGIGGELTWWYLPTIGLVFAGLSLWTAQRIRITRERGRSLGRAPIVALVLAWVCALAFGITVPDNPNGELVSLLSLWAGPGALEMSIGICNPLGILAFACLIAALGFAAAAGRDPHVDLDELDGQMAAHPLDPRA